MDDLLRFFQTFRGALHQLSELSVGEDTAQYGVLTGGDETLPPRVFRYATERGLSGAWVEGTRRFIAAFPPIRYLVRGDWRESRLLALTLYVRLPDELTRADFAAAIEQSAPLDWSGHSPFDLSQAIGMQSPHGFATRVDVLGRTATSVYWYVNQSAYLTHRFVLRPLVTKMAWPEARCDEMLLAIQRASPIEGLAVLGIDASRAPSEATIKLDLPNVSLGLAAPALRERGVSRERMLELERTSRRLSVPKMSYLGLKINRDGWCGWKSYFATQPMRQRSATIGRTIAPSADRPRPLTAITATGFTPLSFD